MAPADMFPLSDLLSFFDCPLLMLLNIEPLPLLLDGRFCGRLWEGSLCGDSGSLQNGVANLETRSRFCDIIRAITL